MSENGLLLTWFSHTLFNSFTVIKISFASPQSEIMKNKGSSSIFSSAFIISFSLFFLLLHHRLQIITGEIKKESSTTAIWESHPSIYFVGSDAWWPSPCLFCISTSTTNWAEVLLQQILEKEKLRSPLSDEDFLLNSFFPRYPQDIRIVRSTKR